MDLPEIRSLIAAKIGRTIAVTPTNGEAHRVHVLSVDAEGFTYHLLDEGEALSARHWWPHDEVAEVGDSE